MNTIDLIDVVNNLDPKDNLNINDGVGKLIKLLN